MKILKQIISYSFIGIGIGSVMNYVIAIFFFPNSNPLGVPSFVHHFSSASQATAVQLFIFALLGILQGFASDLFRNEKLSLLTTSLIHYLFIVLPLVLAGFYLHWFHMTWIYLAFFLFAVSIIYILIYLFCYFAHKKEIQKINNRLHQV
ncbi:DUF3021 domain-containing protein [Streptococcus orisasini]|uniref:DUF3021 domain-containing protein n=1 Tax=Streptococcus orisasini TaxID=1080071 RepID=UPI00071017F8|nr:DUF3021 domain-containing protein [Streptococcus orisasini]